MVIYSGIIVCSSFLVLTHIIKMRLLELCKDQYDVPLLEDSCEAHGSSYEDGTKVGQVWRYVYIFILFWSPYFQLLKVV